MAKDSKSSLALLFGILVAVAALVTILLETGVLGRKAGAPGQDKGSSPAQAAEETDVDTLISAYKAEAALNAQRARKMFRGREILLHGRIKRVGLRSLVLEGEKHWVRVGMKDDLMAVSVSDTVKVLGVTEVPYFEAVFREAPAMRVKGGSFVR